MILYLFPVFQDCRTIVYSSDKNPDSNKTCIFPFNYQDEVFWSCTTTDNNGVHWCATEVSSDGIYVSSKWGICGVECPKESKIYI